MREQIRHIGLIPKVIVPTSSADITRALRGCFRGDLFMSFRFVSFRFKEWKTSNALEMSCQPDILITNKEASALGMF